MDHLEAKPLVEPLPINQHNRLIPAINVTKMSDLSINVSYVKCNLGLARDELNNQFFVKYTKSFRWGSKICSMGVQVLTY